MGRIALFVLLILPAAGCGCFQPEPDESPMGPYTSWEALVEAVECGEAGADVFIRAVREDPVRLEYFTPEAVANYMEALAYDRMLECVPERYKDSEEVVVSFETVFEDPRNIFNNWEAFKGFLRSVYGADLG